MRSSTDKECLDLMMNWSRDSIPILLQFKDDLCFNQAQMRGILKEVSASEVVFLSTSGSPPSCRFVLPLVGAMLSKVTFEEAVELAFGRKFEELSPTERGAVWALRFPVGVVARFPSRAWCLFARSE